MAFLIFRTAELSNNFARKLIRKVCSLNTERGVVLTTFYYIIAFCYYLVYRVVGYYIFF